MRGLVVIAGSLALLSGCDRVSGATNAAGGSNVGNLDQAIAARAAIPLDLSTPDRAIRTIWGYQDADAAIHCAAIEELKAKPGRNGQGLLAAIGERTAHPEFFTGHLGRITAKLRDQSCVPQKFEREINDVKVETDSRAQVTTTVRNVSPIPADAPAPHDYEKKQREDGIRFRYVLTKVEGAWRLEEAYEKSALLDEYRMFENEGSLFPSDAAAF